MSSNNLIVVGIVGLKRAGKDSLCKVIQATFPDKVIRVAFGDAVKREIASLLGVDVEEIERNKTLLRGLLQWWGTDVRREQDPNYWIVRTRPLILAHPAPIKVVTDVRFQNEVDVVRDLGGWIVRVNRPGTEYDGHASELLAATCKADYEVHNVGGISDLRNAAKTLLAAISERLEAS